uniref:RIC3 domain-containing protein n=1 Tax=Elaeophora elaphi TaxID=1147741 RepID=A0A0R3S0T5_9BILA
MFRRRISEEESPLSGWKLGIVIGVIIMCFAMLYPSVLHPLVSSFFRTPPTRKTVTNRPPIHPAMSMRMAANQPDITTPSSSSKGMFAWMLPIYTVGVVAFLIYTLVKSKKKRRIRRHDYSSTESESDDYSRNGGRAGGIGKRKLKGLQERLRQTELAMEKILEQLNTLSAEATSATKQNLIKETENEESLKQCLDQQDGKTEQYLRDLEEALRDFKELSKKYRKGDNESSISDTDPYTDEGIHGDETTIDSSEQCKNVQELNSSDEQLKKRRKS